MTQLGPALAVLILLIVSGVLALLGRVADTRDPDWSTGRLLQVGRRHGPRGS